MPGQILATTSLPTLEEIRAAQELVYSVMQPTPQIVWPLLCERLGTEVWVKHENHTPVGAFKARTAVVYAAELFRESPGITGLVTATRGNHGQSVALAARRFKVSAHIVVPRGNSAEKNTAMRAQGADLIEFGTDYQEAKEHAKKLAAERGWHFVPSYHRDIVKGVATYWLEFFSAMADLDVVYVPIGQGSGICSCAAVRNGMKLKTKIVGVVAEGAPAYALSFEAGRKIAAPVTTLLADGMACRVPDEDSLAVVLENVDHIVQVSEEEIRQAMKIYFIDTHNVAEGAGAAGLAAALKERLALNSKRVGLVISGGNVDHDVFARVLLD
ncbi:Threonine dehydratase [Candidatus Sulfotelmatobacter kueseliae]|uniref:Threonine dehydratase n=1 Tax=Candidatus Sulfotelmatobacter kueseliae TaxID=2042962 RepID=A0A2U3KRF6_9BACT|nr:Threonine dehydratase [Candidatus Sulfotelmatobacter kueseliae]